MKAGFVRYEWENKARTIVSFYFKADAPYRYEAGQYAVITVPHADVDNRGTNRTMTFSSSPHEELLKITMKIYGQDGSAGSSYKRALLGLKPGDKVTIYDALGDMVLPMDTDIPLIFVAGGVGIASFSGILRWLNHTGEKRVISLHYAVRSVEDVVLQSDFDPYPSITKKHYVSQNGDRRMTADDIMKEVSPTSLIYVSGTEAMVEQIRRGLREAGVDNSRIAFDYFDGYSEI